jgi:uncharacterized RDD family membrane protein YckC
MTYPPHGAQAPATTAYASWIYRVLAYIVDGLVAAPFGILAAVVGMGTDEATGLPTINAFYYIFILLAVVIQGYNRWFLQGKTGQSWGKKALGLKLIDEASGQPIGAGKAFLRDLCHLVDSICLIGYLFPLWDAKKQTIADKIVTTIVVK